MRKANEMNHYVQCDQAFVVHAIENLSICSFAHRSICFFFSCICWAPENMAIFFNVRLFQRTRCERMPHKWKYISQNNMHIILYTLMPVDYFNFIEHLAFNTTELYTWTEFPAHFTINHFSINRLWGENWLYKATVSLFKAWLVFLALRVEPISRWSLMPTPLPPNKHISCSFYMLSAKYAFFSASISFFSYGIDRINAWKMCYVRMSFELLWKRENMESEKNKNIYTCQKVPDFISR